MKITINQDNVHNDLTNAQWILSTFIRYGAHAHKKGSQLRNDAMHQVREAVISIQSQVSYSDYKAFTCAMNEILDEGFHVFPSRLDQLVDSMLKELKGLDITMVNKESFKVIDVCFDTEKLLPHLARSNSSTDRAGTIGDLEKFLDAPLTHGGMRLHFQIELIPMGGGWRTVDVALNRYKSHDDRLALWTMRNSSHTSGTLVEETTLILQDQ
ncbi:hypothetical protein GR7B_00011 [Vibrio phage vB_VcorM_GR7B]|nr:hypothetical protein GR7B_00011 [Vibrio phage vB_VcorM_GR7B]